MDSKTDRPQPEFSVTLKSEGLQWNTLGVTETDRAQERLTDSDSKRNTQYCPLERLAPKLCSSLAFHQLKSNTLPWISQDPFF